MRHFSYISCNFSVGVINTASLKTVCFPSSGKETTCERVSDFLCFTFCSMKGNLIKSSSTVHKSLQHAWGAPEEQLNTKSDCWCCTGDISLVGNHPREAPKCQKHVIYILPSVLSDCLPCCFSFVLSVFHVTTRNDGFMLARAKEPETKGWMSGHLAGWRRQRHCSGCEMGCWAEHRAFGRRTGPWTVFRVDSRRCWTHTSTALALVLGASFLPHLPPCPSPPFPPRSFIIFKNTHAASEPPPSCLRVGGS